MNFKEIFANSLDYNSLNEATEDDIQYSGEIGKKESLDFAQAVVQKLAVAGRGAKKELFKLSGGTVGKWGKEVPKSYNMTQFGLLPAKKTNASFGLSDWDDTIVNLGQGLITKFGGKKNKGKGLSMYVYDNMTFLIMGAAHSELKPLSTDPKQMGGIKQVKLNIGFNDWVNVLNQYAGT